MTILSSGHIYANFFSISAKNASDSCTKRPASSLTSSPTSYFEIDFAGIILMALSWAKLPWSSKVAVQRTLTSFRGLPSHPSKPHCR